MSGAGKIRLSPAQAAILTRLAARGARREAALVFGPLRGATLRRCLEGLERHGLVQDRGEGLIDVTERGRWLLANGVRVPARPSHTLSRQRARRRRERDAGSLP